MGFSRQAVDVNTASSVWSLLLTLSLLCWSEILCNLLKCLSRETSHCNVCIIVTTTAITLLFVSNDTPLHKQTAIIHISVDTNIEHILLFTEHSYY